MGYAILITFVFLIALGLRKLASKAKTMNSSMETIMFSNFIMDEVDELLEGSDRQVLSDWDEMKTEYRKRLEKGVWPW